MERVTVEHAGERIVLEVPDGTTDEQIQQHLSGGTQKKQSLAKDFATNAPLANQAESIAGRALDIPGMLGKIVPGAENLLPQSVRKPGQEMAARGDIAREREYAQAGEGLKQLVTHPVDTISQFGENLYNKPGETLGGIAKGIAFDPVRNLVPVAPQINAAAKPVVNAAVAPVKFGKDVVKGALVNPEGTHLVPVGKTHYTPESVKEYMAGNIGKEGLVEQATSDILTSPIDKAALKIAGDQVPVAGKIGEATGERIAADYSSPWKLLTDVASTSMLGIPLNAAKRGAQALADAHLARKLQLTPEFHTKLANDVAPVKPTFSEPAPRLKQPSPEFIAENERKLAELRAQQQAQPPAPVAPEPVAAVETPKDMAIQAVAESAPTNTAEAAAKEAVVAKAKTGPINPQDVLATIRARKTALDPRADYAKMIEEAKAAPPSAPRGPVEPVLTPDQKLAELRAGLAQEPRNALFEQEPNTASVQTGGRSSETGPVAPGPTIGEERRLQTAIDRNPNLMRDPRFRKANNMEMIVPEESAVRFANKKDFEQQQIVDRLAGKPFNGSYKEGDKIISVEEYPNPYYNMAPGKVGEPQYHTITKVTNTKTGEVTTEMTELMGEQKAPLRDRVQQILDRNKGKK